MYAYLEILRPVKWFIAAFGVLVGALLIGFTNFFTISIACLAVFLFLSAGNVINDYFDYEIDKINKSKRPIPSGRIKRNTALYYSVILFLAGFILTIFLSFYNLILATLNFVLLILYSYKLKSKPLIGNLTVSWLVGSSFIFGSLLLSSINLLIILVFLASFSANTSRELIKSIEDMEADKKYGYKTLPIVAGKNFSIFLAIVFIFIAILVSFQIYLMDLLNLNYLYTVVIGDIILLIAGFFAFISPKKSHNFMKLAMLIIVISFIVGAIT